MKSAKLNCWQDRQCGREPGGARAAEFGVCPAAAQESCDGANGGTNGGRICWAIPGTTCAGTVQGTYWEKEQTCRECRFFRRVRCEEVSHFQWFKPGLGVSDIEGLHEELNRVPVLLNLCRDIFASLSPGALLGRIAGEALALTGASCAGAYLLDADSGLLRREAAAGESLLPDSIAVGEDSPPARAMRDHRVCRGTLAATPVEPAGGRAALRGRSTAATRPTRALAVPIGGEPTPVGVLVLVRTDGDFSTDDAWFLWELAMLAGLGIGSSRLLSTTRCLRELDRIKSRHVAQLLHQIGSPLATIACSLAAVLRTSEHLDPEDRGLLESSMDRVASISALSRRLLDLGAIRAAPGVRAARKPVSAASVLLQEIRARQLDADRAGMKIVLDIPRRSGRVKADAEGLRTIFANLLDNAIKYSAGKGKTIHVSQKFDPSAPDGASGSPRGAGTLRITIRDEGIGIPSEDRPRLFEDFQRARNASASGVPGFGLGLAFVKELVTRYDGRIDLQSELGVGTTVSVAFPLASSAARRSGGVSSPRGTSERPRSNRGRGERHDQ